MKKLAVLLTLFIIIAGCSAKEGVDLSGQQLYGYQPNTTLRKERTSSLVEEQQIGEHTLLKYEDGVSFLITPENSILSIEAPSEMEPKDSGNGIRSGDAVDKVIQRWGESFSTRTEQGATIYTYQDSTHHFILEYWTVEDKVHTIRFKAEIK